MNWIKKAVFDLKENHLDDDLAFDAESQNVGPIYEEEYLKPPERQQQFEENYNFPAEFTESIDVTDIISTRSLGMGIIVVLCNDYDGKKEFRIFSKRGTPSARFIECYDSLRFCMEKSEWGSTAIIGRENYSIPTTPVQLFELKYLQTIESDIQEGVLVEEEYEDECFLEKDEIVQNISHKKDVEVKNKVFIPADSREEKNTFSEIIDVPVIKIAQEENHKAHKEQKSDATKNSKKEKRKNIDSCRILTEEEFTNRFYAQTETKDRKENIGERIRRYTHRMTWGHYIEISETELDMFTTWINLGLSDALFFMSVKNWLIHFNKKKAIYSGGYRIKDPISMTRIHQKPSMEEAEKIRDSKYQPLPMGNSDPSIDLKEFLDKIFRNSEEKKESSTTVETKDKENSHNFENLETNQTQELYNNILLSLSKNLQSELFPVYAQKIVAESEYRIPETISIVSKLLSLTNGIKDMIQELQAQEKMNEDHHKDTFEVSKHRINILNEQINVIEKCFMSKISNFFDIDHNDL